MIKATFAASQLQIEQTTTTDDLLLYPHEESAEVCFCCSAQTKRDDGNENGEIEKRKRKKLIGMGKCENGRLYLKQWPIRGERRCSRSLGGGGGVVMSHQVDEFVNKGGVVLFLTKGKEKRRCNPVQKCTEIILIIGKIKNEKENVFIRMPKKIYNPMILKYIFWFSIKS